MSEYRGRGSSRGRGGAPRGFRGRGGGFFDRDGDRGGFRGRGGFSRGRGGPRSRDDFSPPRMSRNYDSSDRGRGPPSRRFDRFEDSFDRGSSFRSKDLYSSPPRDTGRSFDRHSPPPRRDREYMPRSGDQYSSSREYTSPRGYSPPRESVYGSSYKDSFSSGPREEKRPMRDYPPRSSDYSGKRDFRDGPRDFASRDYSSSRNGEFRDSFSSREFREPYRGDSSYGGDMRGGRGGRGRSRFDDRGPPREFSGRGREDRGRGYREDRGRGFMNGSRGGRGSPRGRGRDFTGGRDFSGSRDFSGGRPEKRSPSRDGPGGKRPRMESGDYRR